MGRGWFTFDFVRYETLPQMLEAKVIEQAKALGNFAEEEAMIIAKKEPVQLHRFFFVN